ncbi:unnamed protein product [Caenorhabditis auriculariae]|uniref:Uncharacterized protein n=1 Tax=Caenorhabditis auriculariae TaxID=2777116 RepID=A0A8S1HPR7_9PELO|nr:unnamed protein product [Caenorhabditis auriculariae]
MVPEVVGDRIGEAEGKDSGELDEVVLVAGAILITWMLPLYRRLEGVHKAILWIPASALSNKPAANYGRG